MAIKTAKDLFVSQLRDIYSAEKQAVQAYPKLVKKVSSEDLKRALQVHLEQTKAQVERLDRVFDILDKKSSGKTCEAMKGLIAEAHEALDEIAKGPVLDAAIIAAGQRMEHYEIASYGTVATFAEAMGEREIHDLLAATLQEEKDTDQSLTEVSEAVNSKYLHKVLVDDHDDMKQTKADLPTRKAKKSAPKKAASSKKR